MDYSQAQTSYYSKYYKEIERSWIKTKEGAGLKKSRPCTKRMVLQYMYENSAHTTWIASYEFENAQLNNGTFLSHRACARASDLAIKYPDLVECRKHNRFAFYRIRLENNAELREFIKNNK